MQASAPASPTRSTWWLRPLAASVGVVFGSACASQPQPVSTPGPPTAPNASPARFLYVWAGDKDAKESDFLAVVDVRRESPTYAQVLATVPVGMTGTLPHHLEYELPPAYGCGFYRVAGIDRDAGNA